VYVPLSELGLSQPLSRQRVCLSPQTGGAHSPAGEGLGESQFQRLEKKLRTLPPLWISHLTDIKRSVYDHWPSLILSLRCDCPVQRSLPTYSIKHGRKFKIKLYLPNWGVPLVRFRSETTRVRSSVRF